MLILYFIYYKIRIKAKIEHTALSDSNEKIDSFCDCNEGGYSSFGAWADVHSQSVDTNPYMVLFAKS